MPCPGGFVVVVVVPPLAPSQQCYQPVVLGVVVRFEHATAPAMADRIDQPGELQADCDGYEYAPQDCAKAAPGI